MWTLTSTKQCDTRLQTHTNTHLLSSV